MPEERMRILEMISDGSISAEQGALLIRSLAEAGEEEEEGAGGDDVFRDDPVEREEGERVCAENDPFEARASESVDSEPAAQPAQEPYEAPRLPTGLRRWRAFWLIPFGIGAVITALCGLLVYVGDLGAWHWFWMTMVWTPLLFGIAVIVFSFLSRNARWVHVRVDTGQDEWPRRIAISLPLPLRTTAWFMRIFGRFIPGLDDVPIPIHEVILALQRSLNPDDPLYLQVDDSGGERVEVYIG